MGGRFAGLQGKKLESMKRMIRGGQMGSKEISEFFGVYESFVLEHWPTKAPSKPFVIEVKPEEPEEPESTDPYATEDLDKVDLKEFRKFVQENIDPKLPNNSSREKTITAYMRG